MRHPIAFAALLLALSQAFAEPALPILDPSRVTEKTLPNGLKVIVKEERQWPVVALGMYISAGSRHELAGEAGAAHLVEHLLFEATGDDSQKLAPFIEAMGGRISAATMRDFVHVDVMVASQYLERVLPVLLKAVFQAQFIEKEMTRELSVVKREIADRDDRIDLYLDELLWQSAYDKHPYGRPIGGTAADLGALKYETVKGFYQRNYVPGNAALLAVGDVEPAWLEGKIKQLTAELKPGTAAFTEPPLDAPVAEPRVKAEAIQREVSLLAFAWRAAGIADPTSVCALDLIYTLLGQSGSGRLSTELANKQKLIFSADVEFLTQRQPGLFTIKAIVHPGREEEAQAGILKEVQRLADEPVSADELARAKRLLYAEYAFSNESYDDQVGSMGFYACIDSYRFALDYIDRVMKITPEQIQQAVKQLLRADNYTLVILRGQVGTPDDAAALPGGQMQTAVRS